MRAHCAADKRAMAHRLPLGAAPTPLRLLLPICPIRLAVATYRAALSRTSECQPQRGPVWASRSLHGLRRRGI